MTLRNLKFLLLTFLVVALNACKDAKQTEIPVSDFFKDAEKSSFKISPDGKYISYLKRGDKQKQDLFIRTLSDSTERLAASFTGFSGRDYWWTYDNKIIFSQYNIAANEIKMVALDGASLKVRTLLSEKNVQVQVILNRNKKQPDIITLAMNKQDPTRFDIYRLNVKTGELKPYLINPGYIQQWFPDRDGNIRLVKSSDGVDETIYFRNNDNAQFKPIIKSNFKNSVNPVAYTCIKNSFYALSNANRDKTALVEINAETGKEQRVIFESNKADLSRVDYIRNKQRLDLVSWEEAKPQKHFFDSNTESIYKNISAQLKGYEVNITERDTAETKFIIDTYADRARGAVYLYEKQSNKLTRLTNKSTLNPEDLCEAKPISYTASDGLLINGYLTLPKGGTTNLPVVVMPHDANFGQFGPGGRRDSWRYNDGVQFLANRGYAVLQVNYRGSVGYGKAFYEAGFKELGGKIQQDITDGVHWLIEKKTANPKKIAMMGKGFGGYSGYYGAINHPELYNCIIVQNGVINYLAYIKDVPQFLKSSVARMYEMIGDPEKDATKFMEISPRFHADKIKTPLLVFQDMQDFRVNIPELMLFIRELQRRNVPLTYKGPKTEAPRTEDPRIEGTRTGKPPRSMQRADWRMKANQANIDMYTEVQKFLDHNMGVKR